MEGFASNSRKELIEKQKSTAYDVVIIGGGITGAGIALDAAARGLKTALVEKRDFASGTSSKSTKLIHGGLRYLKQFEIALVREVGRERAIVHRLAPHLVRSERMLLPLIKGGTFGKYSTSLGLMVYDVLAGVERVDQRKMYSKEETLEKEPLLPEDILEGGAIYAEYRTDDARLTMEIIKTARAFGADCINYVKATEFIYKEDKITGLKCEEVLDGTAYEINTNWVVSAAGPWVDELRTQNKSRHGKRLQLTKGVHLVVDHHRFPLRQAIYFDVPDGRMIFAIPRGKTTYIGTTDTLFDEDKNHVLTTRDDAHYLLDAVNHTFKDRKLTLDDVKSSWAGLRPLIYEEGKSASELSRKDEIFESLTGLISIAGGKLTGYRKMAEKVVNLVSQKVNQANPKRKIKSCKTDKLVLSGGPFDGHKGVKAYEKEVKEILNQYDLDISYAHYLVSNYGRQTEYIFELMKGIKEKDGDLKLALAELDYCLNHEFIFKGLDFLERRTGKLYFDIDSFRKVKDQVLETMKEYFGWSPERFKQEQEEVNQALQEAYNFK